MSFNLNVITNQKENIKTINVLIGNERFSTLFNDELFQFLTKIENEIEDAETIEELNKYYESAKEAIKNGEVVADIEKIDEYVVYSKSKREFYLKTAKKTFTSYPLPKVFVDKIIATREKGLSVMPLIKNFIRLMRNKKFSKAFAELYYNYITAKYTDKKMLASFLEQGYTDKEAESMSTFEDISFTKSGMLNTYKYAQIEFTRFNAETGEKEDVYEVEFDEVTGTKRYKLDGLTIDKYKLIPPVMGRHCDKFFVDGALSHDIKVGSIHKLDQFDSSTFQHNSMGRGLYAGGLRYIDGYGGTNRVLLNLFIDPANICAFNGSMGDSSAMKVSEYFVHSAVDVPSTTLYKESTYLEHTDAEWNKIADEAIDAIEKKREFLADEADQLKSMSI